MMKGSLSVFHWRAGALMRKTLVCLPKKKKPKDTEGEEWWCVEKVKGNTMVIVSSTENH